MCLLIEELHMTLKFAFYTALEHRQRQMSPLSPNDKRGFALINRDCAHTLAMVVCAVM